jgi:superfamily II DNA/RNA helicase
MPPEITRLTETFLHNPVRIEVARQATAAENISQAVCLHRPARRDTADSEKRELLRRLMKGEGDKLTNAIVFCNRKRDVGIVHKSLVKHGFNAGAIHGDLDQSVRMKVLAGFRDGEIQIMVASDVAARGLDIPTVSHVFNYDVPIHSEDYVHRIGRTGRAGRSGSAITLCFPHEEKHLAKIEELVGKDVPRIDDPMAGETPAAEAEESGGRSRRGRKPRREEAPKAEAARDETAEVEAKDEKRERKAPQKAPRKSEEPAAEKAPEKAEETSSGRSRGGDNGRGRDKGRGNDRGGDNRRGGRQVVGMGDHVPEFMTREVDVKSVLRRSRGSAADEAEESEKADEHEAA